MRLTRFPLLLLVALSGCASGLDAVFGTLQESLNARRSDQGVALNPAIRYLRVTLDGRVALLVLGNVDPHPDGPIEVWYSAQREVLRLQNGRVVGTAGMTEEWRAVRQDKLPAWRDIIAQGRSLQWQRSRDLMPGYRLGVRDTLELRPIAPPGNSKLKGLSAPALVWFEETLIPAKRSTGFGALPPEQLDLPPARYALAPQDPDTVLYGEQCLTRSLCLSWQRWPATAGPGPAP